MNRKLQASLALVALTLAPLASAARADGERPLKTEAGFLSRMGERALPVAPGVYEVVTSAGDRVRVAFGEAGRLYDQARLQAEIQAAESDKMVKSRRIQVLTRALQGLEETEAETEKAAETGGTCEYDFELDGGHNPWIVGGTSWGNASIWRGVQFPNPFFAYPKRSAYTYVMASAMLDQLYTSYQEDYDEVAAGLTRPASTSATVDCGSATWSCYSWESFSYVREYGCKGGYRSISRAG